MFHETVIKLRFLKEYTIRVNFNFLQFLDRVWSYQHIWYIPTISCYTVLCIFSILVLPTSQVYIILNSNFI